MNLLRRLFRSSQKPRLSFVVPEGQRLFAVGDIHGRSDLLARITDLIADDIATSWPDAAVTVFVGDYVDRGPDAPGVLEQLSCREFPTGTTFLRGNHENMLLEFLADPANGVDWVKNGGLETLHAYGVDVRPLRARAGVEQAAEDFRQALPAAHASFLRNTQSWCAYGDFYFCHAGVRPGVPLDHQNENDLLWIREPFLSSHANFGKRIVHGHSPVVEPEVRPNRINIDTGAYISGRLTCVVLETDRVRFLSTGQNR